MPYWLLCCCYWKDHMRHLWLWNLFMGECLSMHKLFSRFISNSNWHVLLQFLPGFHILKHLSYDFMLRVFTWFLSIRNWNELVLNLRTRLFFKLHRCICMFSMFLWFLQYFESNRLSSVFFGFLSERFWFFYVFCVRFWIFFDLFWSKFLQFLLNWNVFQ
jgi:hypothetical protein